MPVEMESEKRQLVSGSDGQSAHLRPSARDSVDGQDQHHDGARDINQELHDVGPNDGGEASLERVEQRQRGDDQDGGEHPGPENDADDDGNREDTNTLGQRASYQEQSGGQDSQVAAESPLDELVGGEKLSCKILRNEDKADDNPRHEIPEDKLQEVHVRRVRDSGRADD